MSRQHYMKLVICKKKKKKTGSFSPAYCSYRSTAAGKNNQSEPGLCLMECLTAINHCSCTQPPPPSSSAQSSSYIRARLQECRESNGAATIISEDKTTDTSVTNYSIHEHIHGRVSSRAHQPPLGEGLWRQGRSAAEREWGGV